MVWPVCLVWNGANEQVTKFRIVAGGSGGCWHWFWWNQHIWSHLGIGSSVYNTEHMTRTAHSHHMPSSYSLKGPSVAHDTTNLSGVGVVWALCHTLSAEVANGIAEGWASKAAMPGTNFSLVSLTQPYLNWLAVGICSFDSNVHNDSVHLGPSTVPAFAFQRCWSSCSLHHTRVQYFTCLRSHCGFQMCLGDEEPCCCMRSDDRL